MSNENQAAIACIFAGTFIALVAIPMIKRAVSNPFWGLLAGAWIVWGIFGVATLIDWYFELGGVM